MAGAALTLFAVLSVFIAFGSWPGAHSSMSVDQIVLRAVERAPHASKVTVRPDAVAIARRQARRAHTVASAQTPGHAQTRTPGAPATGGGSPGATQVASAPSSGGGGTAGNAVKNATNQVGNTTKQVQQTTGNVQNQVNQVVNQVTGGGPPPTPATSPSGPVQQTTTTVTNTVNSVLGH